MSETRDRIAKILAKQYWLGRIESVQQSGQEEMVINRMATIASEEDYHRFKVIAQTVERITYENIADRRDSND